MANDFIRREALKEAFRNDVMGGLNWESIINKAPAAEFDEDTIQQFLKKRCMSVVTNEYLIQLHNARPKGEWIETRAIDHYGNTYCGFSCSHCNALCGCARTNFCPDCGADMRKDGTT